MADKPKDTGKFTKPKRRKDLDLASESAPAVDLPAGAAEAVLNSPAAGEPGEKKRAATLSIPLKEDGSIDTENMRDSTKEKLQRAMSTAPVSLVVGESLKPEDVIPLLDALGAIKRWAAIKFFGIDTGVAAVQLYSPGEKEITAPPLAKVIGKYIPAVSKYADEAALILTLYAIESDKWQRMVAMQAELNQARANAAARDARPAPQGGGGANITEVQ